MAADCSCRLREYLEDLGGCFCGGRWSVAEGLEAKAEAKSRFSHLLLPGVLVDQEASDVGSDALSAEKADTVMCGSRDAVVGGEKDRDGGAGVAVGHRVAQLAGKGEGLDLWQRISNVQGKYRRMEGRGSLRFWDRQSVALRR